MKTLYTDEEFKNAKAITKLPLECQYCHNTFYQEKRRIQAILSGKFNYTGVFCSPKCNNAFRYPVYEVTCNQCGKSFRKQLKEIKKSKNHFCCHSCAAIYRNSHKVKGTRVSKLEIWLQEQLAKSYPKIEFHFNRKDTINSELDIYIPSLKLAFELNGIFHYEPIYGFDKLSATKNNDNRKLQACFENGIEICIIDISSMKNFKEKNATKYLDIIINIIEQRLKGI